jgi:hypothetical protein
MANPTCTRDTLITGGKCIKNFDLHRRKALKVYAMAQQLAAIGGTDYTTFTDGTLNEAANAFRLLNLDEMAVSWIVLEINNAVEAGATISADPQTLATEIQPLAAYPDWKLKLMELLLRCELGRAESYPQT